MVWPRSWYFVVFMSAFIYLLPTWVDYALPPPVADRELTVTTPVVHPGGQLSTVAIRCNSSDLVKSYTYVRVMQAESDGTELPLSFGETIASPGCHQVKTSMLVVPSVATPGAYRLVVVLHSQGIFREVSAPVVTAPFEVVP